MADFSSIYFYAPATEKIFFRIKLFGIYSGFMRGTAYTVKLELQYRSVSIGGHHIHYSDIALLFVYICSIRIYSSKVLKPTKMRIKPNILRKISPYCVRTIALKYYSQLKCEFKPNILPKISPYCVRTIALKYSSQLKCEFKPNILPKIYPYCIGKIAQKYYSHQKCEFKPNIAKIIAIMH